MEGLALGFEGRIEEKLTIADENGAGDFVVYRGGKADGARTEAEGAGVALEIDVGETNGFGTEGETAKSGVHGGGVGVLGPGRLGDREKRKDDQRDRVGDTDGPVRAGGGH